MKRVALWALLAVGSTSFALLGPRNAEAQDRPNYSGEWVLRVDRSTLDQRIWAGLERGTLRLVHREPSVECRRAFVVKGQPDEAVWTMTTNGEEQVKTAGAQTRRSRLSWTGQTLVLSERVTARQGEATNTVEYRLLDNGRALEARERFKGPRLQYENIYVFEKH